ncbi:demethoxyubiquinone hydroxylase family protein, partial [Xanthomonas perforans]
MAVGSTAERGQNRRMTQNPPPPPHSPPDPPPVETHRGLDTLLGNPPAERPQSCVANPERVLDPA